MRGAGPTASRRPLTAAARRRARGGGRTSLLCSLRKINGNCSPPPLSVNSLSPLSSRCAQRQLRPPSSGGQASLRPCESPSPGPLLTRSLPPASSHGFPDCEARGRRPCALRMGGCPGRRVGLAGAQPRGATQSGPWRRRPSIAPPNALAARPLALQRAPALLLWFTVDSERRVSPRFRRTRKWRAAASDHTHPAIPAICARSAPSLAPPHSNFATRT